MIFLIQGIKSKGYKVSVPQTIRIEGLEDLNNNIARISGTLLELESIFGLIETHLRKPESEPPLPIESFPMAFTTRCRNFNGHEYSYTSETPLPEVWVCLNCGEKARRPVK